MERTPSTDNTRSTSGECLCRIPSQITRRAALHTIAGLSITALAGCSSEPGTSPTNSSPTPNSGKGVIDRIAVEGLQLVIELTDSTDIDRINVIGPTDELFAKRSVATGVQQLSVQLGTDYSPGTFRVLAIKDEETLAEKTITIQPDWEITEFGLGANQPEEMPDDMPQSAVDDEAFLTVRNRGTGPDAVEQLLILGKVPNPTTDLAQSDSSETGFRGPDGRFNNSMVVEPSKSKRIFTVTLPFRFVRDGNVTCQSESQSGTFRVILETSVVGRRSTEYSIEYSAAQTFDGCTMSVRRADQ